MVVAIGGEVFSARRTGIRIKRLSYHLILICVPPDLPATGTTELSLLYAGSLFKFRSAVQACIRDSGNRGTGLTPDASQPMVSAVLLYVLLGKADPCCYGCVTHAQLTQMRNLVPLFVRHTDSLAVEKLKWLPRFCGTRPLVVRIQP